MEMNKDTSIVQKPNNVIVLNAKKQEKTSVRLGGSSEMDNHNFVTQKDLNNLEEKTDLKLELINNKIDNGFNNISEKIDLNSTKLLTDVKLLLSEQEIKNKKEAESSKRWLIGIAVSIILFVVKEYLQSK